MSSDIQNDLMHLLFMEIKNEIEETAFITLIMDETTDVRKESQLSTVFSYIDKHRQIKEKYCLHNSSNDCTVNVLVQYAYAFILTENQ